MIYEIFYTMTFPEKLLSCWHPVMYAHELGEKPSGTQLLGEHLVIWRDGAGKPHAMRDLCIHRGTALSLGWVKDDCIVCPYHGWRYNAAGNCTLIPQMSNPNIPTKARVDAYACVQRYGLIWVCLHDTPTYPLPELPELENGSYKIVNTGPFQWNADASRQIENFTDFGHFPWVHPGLLGDVNRPLVPDYTVETHGHVLHYNIVRPERQKQRGLSSLRQ